MSDPRNYTVGWICAIETEYTAAQTFLDNEHEPPDRLSTRDTNHYTLGDVVGHNVVMAVLPNGEYGTSSAANVVTNMLTSFPNIAIGLLVGIGGGAPTRKDNIRLGDIVVSSPNDGSPGVYQYDYGKTIQGSAFVQTGFLNQPPTVVRSAVTGLKSKYRRKGHRIEETIESILEMWPRLKKDFSRPPPESDRLYASRFVHSSSLACDRSCTLQPDNVVKRQPRQANHDNPYVHHRLIASGNQLMKDALIRDRYAKDQGVLCFEMEAAGIMNHFPCLVIRGICDYSDSHKNERWQGYAAMAAAAYAKDLLGEIHRTTPHNSGSASGLNTGAGGGPPKTYTVAYKSTIFKPVFNQSRNIAAGSQSRATTEESSRNLSFEDVCGEDFDSGCASHTSLESSPLEESPPQWTTSSWFDETFEMQGFCPTVVTYDGETLTRMMSADENIKLDVAELTVQARAKPFTHGPFRKLFYARTQASENRFVLKTFITGTNDDRAKVAEDMRIQTLCKAFALNFNGLLGIDPPLDFTMTSCLQRKPKTDSECMSLERFVEGKFVKYNSNAGWVNETLLNNPLNQMVQAFSHFTFERSEGVFLVSNISGVDHLLTSPTIHTRDEERFKLQGGINFHEEGFNLFFLTHECNTFCHKLGLKSTGEMFVSGEFEFRKEWPIVTPAVCCSNRLCRSIVQTASSHKSSGHHWCDICWKQLYTSTVWRSCFENGWKHEFEVSRFFYESQGQVPPSRCPIHRGRDTP
jgi:nucleoside phosphorylase